MLAFRISILVIVASFFCPTLGLAQTNHNSAPINYDTTEPTDRVAKLISKLESQDLKIEWSDETGWLTGVLDSLEIPSASQTLVFSKTSQQIRKIRPSSPRAIYFNEDVYLGYVQGGDFLELAAVDPVQGAIFYTIAQTKSDAIKIKQASSQCLSCHETHKTQKVPGFLVRSVFPKKSGHPEFRLGTTPTDHRTPFKDRFGGWYVTGQHGQMRHRGNAFVREEGKSESDVLDREAGANLTTLPDLVDAQDYLEPTSDIVALMILEHQTQFHNFVTKASFETRMAMHYQLEMNRILDRKPEFLSDSTKRRIKSAADDLVDYLLFVDEPKLTSPIKGSDKFIKSFAVNSIRDPKDRSLHDLDLNTRLLKYPCSYLIYSESFQALPAPVLKLVIAQLKAVLQSKKTEEKYQHISAAQKQAITEILSQTHPLFENWKVDAPSN